MRRPHSWGPGELLAHEEGDGTVAARADVPSHRRRGTEEGPKPSAPSSRCPRLEPYDKRLSRTVLRGLGGRKAPRLPDGFRAGEFNRPELQRRLIPLQARLGRLLRRGQETPDRKAAGVCRELTRWRPA